MTRPGVLCVVAAAPSVTPWSVCRERAALREGGVDAVFATVASLEDSGDALTRVSQWLRIHEDPAFPVRVAASVREIRAAKAAGDTAVVLHFQGAEPLRAGTELAGAFARLGVRVIQPTYNYRGLAGDGCCEPGDGGLSRFGRALIGAMNLHRIAVDIAHAGIRTSLDAITCSTRPVIASHANARAVCDHPRNLPDEVIKAVAASGGVIGLCAFPSFVSAEPEPALDQLIDHAVHIADLIGADQRRPEGSRETGQEVSRCRGAGFRGAAGYRHVWPARRRWPACEPGSERAPGCACR
ncbi:MAG TPA: membrane dipeptidase [Streptosporangiaceae bacterium]